MYVDCYFNTDVKFEKYLGNNNKNRMDTYAEPKTIKCRLENKKVFIRNTSNEQVLSKQLFMTSQEINVKDKLNGQYIESVDTMYDFDGNIIYYEAYV